MTIRERLFPFEAVNQKRIKKDIQYLKNEDVTGLDFVLSSIVDFANSGLFEESLIAYNAVKHNLYRWSRAMIPQSPEDTVYILAYKNLNYVNYLDFMHRKSLNIDFLSFICMYEFLTLNYFMTVKSELDGSDINNIYLSGLDEQLIFGFDKFDKIANWPQPTAELFKRLQKVMWEDMDTRKFSNRLDIFKVDLTITSLGLPKYAHFNAIGKQFRELIAGCYAVNESREYVTKTDVIIGFNTYLKLLNTDVTKYKARNIQEGREHVGEGYLVCDKCYEYYKLQPGESPEDFSNQCECGGKLRYCQDITSY